MGIFSSIGKAFKSVFKGIMKVFSPILKPLGKLMNSSLGKAIMIGLSIFTLGTAMVAGYGAFSASMAASNGFIASFVEGGKVFMGSLLGKGADEASTALAEGGAQTGSLAAEQAGIAAQSGSMNPALLEGGQSAIDAGGALAEGASGSMAFGPEPAGDVMNMATSAGGGAEGMAGSGSFGPGGGIPEAAGEAAQVAELTSSGGGVLQEAGGGWLDSIKEGAANMFKEDGFLRSEGGGQVAGALISGVGNYYTEKDRQEFQDRIRRSWGDPNNAGVRSIRASGQRAANLPAPTGVPAKGRATARNDPGATRPYYDRQYGASAPAGG